MMTKVKPNLSNMHIFGIICYSYIENKKKLDALSKQGIFLGYDTESPAYLIYFPEQNDVKKNRCVKFTEKFTVVIFIMNTQSLLKLKKILN